MKVLPGEDRGLWCALSAVLLPGGVLLQVLSGLPPPGPALEQVLGQHTPILLPDLGREFGGFSCVANYTNLNDELDKICVCMCVHVKWDKILQTIWI